MASRTANTKRNLIDNAATENDRSDLISQFWQQWQESRGQLYRCCLKMMNFNRMDAEDALSQAMVKAWEKVQKFGEKITNLKAWLYQVTRNFCIDIIRKRSCAAVGIESIEWVGNTEEVITTGTVECPESVLEREERSERIRGAIAELPEKLRETFILHFYRELSHQEIADRQGISYDNVCKRISLARKRLKERLSAYFRGTDGEVRETREIKKEGETPEFVEGSVELTELANQTVEETGIVSAKEYFEEVKAEIPEFVDSSIESRELVSQTVTKVANHCRELLRYGYVWRWPLMWRSEIFRLPVLLLSWIQNHTTSGFINPFIENIKLSSIAHCPSKYIGGIWDRTLADTGGAIAIFFRQFIFFGKNSQKIIPSNV
ncbi:sigma-70 family RNA polymerase sigma factor [Moorena sp. SIO3H5]|uniref:RNA polymerase sigma factor n=1 Tax=Moorena sp. SIO3H5 TaxID=2607834 RepID=UPI0013B7D1B9|nr:sigma-70 family RNA polymerase sigma factor [Moorena sp. SIO3H5]NEO67983.1 sigma-70 family RNA polymerase sigma factor [Moorena sp. SIO3H5]